MTVDAEDQRSLINHYLASHSKIALKGMGYHPILLYRLLEYEIKIKKGRLDSL